ncbi:MAG: hypothetical protein ACR2PZ_11735 [Pseudomonadales bacterium]
MTQSDLGEDTRRALKELAKSLKRDRERLTVQLKLGEMELKEEWEGLEHKWNDFEDKVEDMSQEAMVAATAFGEELNKAYQHMLDRLKRN